MKKVVSLVLSFTLALCLPIYAFAYEGSTNNQSPYSGSGSTTINAKIYGSCYVSIPETVEVLPEQNWEIAITDINIAATDAIKVYVTNVDSEGCIQLSNPNETNTIDVRLSRGDNIELFDEYGQAVLVYYRYGDSANNEYFTTFSGEITNDTQGYKAGTYSGTMLYTVSIEPCS